ncbi:MAG: hypothetical protein OEW44_02325 [Gemmatimonadota bacterium]|nr:hypothetical protein [Gemmatimonadota bacterium]
MTDRKTKISPYYQMLGGVSLLLGGGMALLKIEHETAFTLYDAIGMGIFALVALAMLLPDVFKSIVAALPFTKYTKPDA